MIDVYRRAAVGALANVTLGLYGWTVVPLGVPRAAEPAGWWLP